MDFLDHRLEADATTNPDLALDSVPLAIDFDQEQEREQDHDRL
jgi:hypothetical protein